MTTNPTDNVSSRILAAATLAEQHAQLAQRDIDGLPLGGTYVFDYAAGPSHWGAVAELLRAVPSAHRKNTLDPFCNRCGPRSGWPCPTVAALLPLADQIIRDLGDSQ